MKKDAKCYVEVSQDQIVFIVTGKSRTTQARASLQSSVFDAFEIETPNEGHIQFVVTLSTVLDCLQVFLTF